MAATRKVIITCAVTGAIHTPTMSPYLPITPEQIATSAVEAAEAGAAILHLHARDPQSGCPTPNAEVFLEFLPEIKQRTDAIINITTGGGHNMTVEQRLAAPLRLQPEMCSCNMGSMNFGLFPAIEKFSNWQHPWETQYLERTRDFIFKNTFADIETILEKLGRGCGTRFEFECYDIGHLYNLAYFVETGMIKPPFLVQTIFGVMGGIGADPENVFLMKQTADRLFGRDYVWSLFAAGRKQMPFAAMGAVMGANVRVGLEDSLYLGHGRLATSNAEQVTKVRTILTELGLEVASPDEAREMLKLKGRNNVSFS